MTAFIKKQGLLITALVITAIAAYCLFAPLDNTAEVESPLFKINLGTEPPTLDATQARDMTSITVIQNLMRGLVTYDHKGNIVPACAKRWTMSPDGKHWVFYLRNNLRWSDGQKLTAQQFVNSAHRALDSKNAAPYAFFLFNLKNGKAFYDGKLSTFKTVGIHAPNDSTVEITLEHPVAFFLNLLAFPVAYPIREDLIKQHPNNYTEAGVLATNGPYQLSKWAHDDYLLLKPNTYYYGPQPKNPNVQMLMIPEPATSLRMYENGELDFVETASSIPVKEVRRIKNRKDYHSMTLHGLSYFGFNTQKPPVNNIKVRQALAMAFDRTMIPRILQSGERPWQTWISPGLLGGSEKENTENGIAFNPEKAKELLVEAGYPNGKGFPKLQFMVGTNNAESSQLAEMAQFQWKKYLNIDVDIQRVEFKVFLSQLSHDPPMMYKLQWYVDYADPDSFMTVFVSDSGNGNINWKSKQYDTWVNAAAQSNNARVRKQLYDKAQKLLLQQAAGIIPIYAIPKSYLLRPGTKGFTMSPLNLVMLD